MSILAVHVLGRVGPYLICEEGYIKDFLTFLNKEVLKPGAAVGTGLVISVSGDALRTPCMDATSTSSSVSSALYSLRRGPVGTTITQTYLDSGATCPGYRELFLLKWRAY
jgi:hypothetical protein